MAKSELGTIVPGGSGLGISSRKDLQSITHAGPCEIQLKDTQWSFIDQKKFSEADGKCVSQRVFMEFPLYWT